jgi:hypothetical protein
MQSRHHSLDWLKWLAVISMFVDHLRFIPSPLTHYLFYLGRPAFPIFALLCGWNLVLYSRHPAVFVWRVSLLAAGMAILQFFAFQSFWPANPIVNLALGLALVLPLCQRLPDLRTGQNWLLCFGLLALFFVLTLALPAKVYLAEGWAGIMLVICGALFAAQAGKSPPILSMLPAALACAVLAWHINGSNTPANVIALLAGLTALTLLLKNPLPRCPAPNNMWLYLAFPLSLLPAMVWQWLSR